MFRRHGRRRPDQCDRGPVVFDAEGLPLGVYVPPRADPGEPTRESRHHARLAALRKTRELDGQYLLRSQVCLFCATPPT